MSSAEDEFLLKWHDHHQSFFLLVEELVMREQLTDVTLACGPAEDQQLLSAHSLMLSVCSPYFRSLLTENRHKEKHHIIHLSGVTGRHMQQLLVYMYRGEISISQEDLGPLIETAKCLQIKGLAMAQPNVNISASPPPPAQKKRSFSQLSPVPPNVQINSSPTFPSSNSTPIPPQQLSPNRLSKKIKRPPSTSPYNKEETLLSSQECTEPDIKGEIPEEKTEPCLEINALLPDVPLPDSFLSPKSNRSSQPVSLPILPKPLSILKTAETRTYLSKLIWIGNGGRRPQYGNPETKPGWWPQHILPWGEMKKMGGRKSVELSHINYTEVLKQCLAAGYEYFGYDTSTYYNTDHEHGDQENCSYIIEDGQAAEEDSGPCHGDRAEKPLEIDLDRVPNDEKKEAAAVCKSVRDSTDTKQILCK